MKMFYFMVIFTLLLAPVYSKGFRGKVSFTEAEKNAHNENIDAIVKDARLFLTNSWDKHVNFYSKNGFSKYYGVANTKLSTAAERKEQLKKLGHSSSRESELIPTSCVGFSLLALKNGFLSSGNQHLASVWKKVDGFTRLNDGGGLALIHALRKLGWKVCYWNPDPERIASWDLDETHWPKIKKGWHAYRFKNVTRRGTYYFNSVDDRELLVGFKKAPPEEFTKVPFFVGVAHTGYHVFPGFEGEIIEAHSTKGLTQGDQARENTSY